MNAPAPQRQLKPKPKQEPVDGPRTVRARSSSRKRSPVVDAPSFRLVGLELDVGTRKDTRLMILITANNQFSVTSDAGGDLTNVMKHLTANVPWPNFVGNVFTHGRLRLIARNLSSLAS